MAQVDLGAGAIGGKDSMSGTFEQFRRSADPDLLRRGGGQYEARHLPEFKGAGHRVVRIAPRYNADGLTPDKDALLEVFSAVEDSPISAMRLAVSTAKPPRPCSR